MSRSYHVTEKKALAAFLRGDNEPTYTASEKSWVKKKEKLARVVTKIIGKKSLSNRTIVAREKKRTADALSAIEFRKQTLKAVSKR